LSKLPALSAEDLDVVLATASSLRAAKSSAQSRQTSGKTRGNRAKPATGQSSGQADASKAGKGRAKKGPPQAVSQFAGVPEFEAFKASDRVLRAALRRNGGLTLKEAERLCDPEVKLEEGDPLSAKVAQAGLEQSAAQAELGPALASFREAQGRWFSLKGNLKDESAAQESPEQPAEAQAEQA